MFHRCRNYSLDQKSVRHKLHKHINVIKDWKNKTEPIKYIQISSEKGDQNMKKFDVVIGKKLYQDGIAKQIRTPFISMGRINQSLYCC